METITKACECGQSFETEAHPEWRILESSHCPECEVRRDAEREREQAAEATRKIDELQKYFRSIARESIPQRMLQTDVASPQFNRALWAKVKAWQPTDERPWLGLIGNPGECKTRIAYLRLLQFADERAASGWKKFKCAVISGMDFNRHATERYSKGKIEGGWAGAGVSIAEISSEALREARTASILIFDELGKVRSSPGTIDELFAVIDFRHANNLPTVWTSNRTPEQFCASWPEEFAGPGCGRILESSTILQA